MPRFREGDFYGGINAGLDRMIRVIDGEPLPAPAQAAPAAQGGPSRCCRCLLILALVGGVDPARGARPRSSAPLATGGAVGFARLDARRRAGDGAARGRAGVLLHADGRRRSGRRYGGFPGGCPGGFGAAAVGAAAGSAVEASAAVAAASAAAALRGAGRWISRASCAICSPCRARCGAPSRRRRMAAIEQAIARSETQHRGEVRFAVEAALDAARPARRPVGARARASKCSRSSASGTPRRTTAC